MQVLGSLIAGPDSVSLAPGVALRLSMPPGEESLVLSLLHEGEVVGSATAKVGATHHTLRYLTGLVSVRLDVDVDGLLGEVVASGEVRVRDPLSGHWDTLLDLEGDVLARYAPVAGVIGTTPVPDPPAVDDPEYGKSRPTATGVTRLFVDDEERLLTDVGRRAKARLWADRPGFVFNTVACVGSYVDPDSPWFNVFLGYYQIDVAKKEWGRPFAYESAQGIDSRIDFEDIVRLGKTDWNWFSNWMYGVPEPDVLPCDGVDMSEIPASQADAGTLGATRWHYARVGNVEFVSAYESDAPGAARLVDNSLLSPTWRRSYGEPAPRPAHTTSFPPTRLDAELYIAYWEDEASFHTVMFGGTAPVGADPRFLALQMDASRAVVERSYPTLGFAPA